jgi:uncharacterized protein YxeA
MKNFFTFVFILIVILICYVYFVREASKDDDNTAVSRRQSTVKSSQQTSGTKSVDQNPVRRTRIGKKLDNLYDKHNKYSNEALD